MRIRALPLGREVPDSWGKQRFKFLFELQDRPPRPSDDVLTAYRDGQVTLRSIRRSEGYTEAIKEYGYQGVRRGDLVISSMDAFAGAVGVAESDGKASPVYHVHLPGRGVDARYFVYLLRDLAQRGFILSLAKGIRERSTAFDVTTCRSLELPVPPTSIQRRIADFLDRETARIDGLIGSKQRLLVVLQERWRNEVVKAVTQGLSNAELVSVDSPWFARRPPNWSLEPLKRRWTVIDCKHFTPVYVDHGYALVSHAEIEDGRVSPGRSGHFVEEADYLNLTKGRRPKRGDVIYTRNAAIGNAGYVDGDEEFAMGQDVCLVTSEEQDQRFLTYFLNYVAVEQLAAERLGATFGRINVGQIVDLQILCPPVGEQRAIADQLDARRRMYEALNTRLQAQTKLLAERRQALITAAVIGSLDVLDEAG